MRSKQGLFMSDKCHVPPFESLKYVVVTKHEGSFYSMRDVRTSISALKPV